MSLHCCLWVTACLVAAGIGLPNHATAHADDAAAVRSQAVVNLTFDEATGEVLDTAGAGAAKDNGTLMNGALRVKSPFWGQSGKQAVALDAGAKQFVQVPDSPDVDRPEAVSFSLLFVNLHPAADAAYHGIVAKRDEAKLITNYGINYAGNTDTFQVYINDGAGYKVANYSVNAAVGSRRPVFITAVFQVGDAPAPDADEDKDDVLIRFYANGQPVKPKGATGGTATGNDVWLIDVKVANLLTDTPLTLGASTPAAEYTSCLIDEFSLFPRALSNEEVAKLFVEVAGPNALTQIADEAKPVPAGPEISGLSLTGLTRGHTTVLAITGSNLLPDPQLVSSAPIEKQVLHPGATAERVEFEVTVPATAPAGHFPVRVQTARGISGALTIAVDSLPQVAFAESTPDKPVALPAAISGSLTGQQQLKAYFAGKTGQHVVIDLECRRLGAAMDPVLELRNPRGAPLAIAWGRPQYGGDTRIEANLFMDGIYTVELHDLAYKAPGQNSFRLKIGDLKLVDTTFPSGVSSGQQRTVAAIGPGMDAGATLAVDMQNQLAGLVRSVGLPPDTGTVGPAPMIVTGAGTEFVEEPQPDGKLQTIDAQFNERAHVPLVINGRISKHGESDRFVLNVKPGMKLNFTTDTYSIGSPLDAQLLVLSHPEGVRVAMSEDRPALEFTVPAETTAIQIAVQDLNHRGGPDFVYRLKIVPAGQPDFSVAIGSERISLPRDGSAVIRLDVTRTGYDGPITLLLEGAPELRLSPAEIPVGVSKAFVVLSANSAEAAPAALVRHLRLTGTSVGLNPPLVRVAAVPPDNRLSLIPGARSDLACALTGPSAVALELGVRPPAWFKGTDTVIPVKLAIQNPEMARHTVRLTLLTTEATRVQADPTDPTQQRKITLPLVRSLPEQTLSAGETAGTLHVAVPLDVFESQIDCVVRADFVPHSFSDKVLASVYSPPFRLNVQNAVTVQLAASTLALTGNAQAKFAGTVKRTAGFTGPVDVAIVNLPAGYTAPKLTLAADQEQFEIAVGAPAVTAAADIPNVQFRITTPAGSPLERDRPLAVKVAP